MSDDQNKLYKVEWAFSFEKLGAEIGDFVKTMGSQGDDAIKQEQFSAPLEDATSATIRIDLSMGEHVITTLPPESTNLIEADLAYVGEIKFVVAGQAERQVTLSHTSGPGGWLRTMAGWMGSGGRIKWHVGLSPNLPIGLDVRGGLGESHINLAAMQARHIFLKLGTGEVTATLPGGAYRTSVEVGIGQFNLNFPDQAQLDLGVDAGTSEVNITLGQGCTGAITIKGGVGECNVTLPVGTAVRVEASTGLGAVDVKNHALNKVRGGDEFMSASGVWETAGYEAAEAKLHIHYEGGIGAFNLR